MGKDQTHALVCVECGSKYVTNKKYCLCGECIFKKTHDGKSKREVYAERSACRIAEREGKQNSIQKKDGSRIESKKKYSIKKVSDRTRYKTSQGQILSQAEVNYNYKETCYLIDQIREPVCEGCGRGGIPLSHSHTISRARCKELGKIELIWDAANLFFECWSAPTSNPTTCHGIWELSVLEKKKRLFNFDRKMEYLQIHDPETYKRYGGE